MTATLHETYKLQRALETARSTWHSALKAEQGAIEEQIDALKVQVAAAHAEVGGKVYRVAEQAGPQAGR